MYCSTEDALNAHNIPLTEAHASLYEQLERFEMARERRDGAYNIMLTMRLRVAEAYQKNCPKDDYRPEAVIGVLMYSMQFHGWNIKTDAIPKNLLLKTRALIESYQLFMTARGFPSEKSDDMRCCAAIEQCYLFALCQTMMDFSESNSMASASIEYHLTRLGAARQWDVHPGFRHRFASEVNGVTQQFTQRMKRAPSVGRLVYN